MQRINRKIFKQIVNIAKLKIYKILKKIFSEDKFDIKIKIEKKK
jgi:hypothetical protein